MSCDFCKRVNKPTKMMTDHGPQTVSLTCHAGLDGHARRLGIDNGLTPNNRLIGQISAWLETNGLNLADMVRYLESEGQ